MLISAHGSLVPWLLFCMWSRGKNSLVNGLFQFHVVSKQQLARDIELQRELKGPSKLREICMSVSVSMRWHTNACVSQIERSMCTDRGLWVKVTKVSNFNVSVANVEVQPYIIFWWVEWEKKKCKSFYGIHKNLYTRFKSDRLIQINSITSVTNCMFHVCWHSMIYLCHSQEQYQDSWHCLYISVYSFSSHLKQLWQTKVNPPNEGKQDTSVRWLLSKCAWMGSGGNFGHDTSVETKHLLDKQLDSWQIAFDVSSLLRSIKSQLESANTSSSSSHFTHQNWGKIQLVWRTISLSIQVNRQHAENTTNHQHSLC